MTNEFKWKKLGRVFVPDGSISWAKHYAQVPTPVLLGDRIRVFFTSRPDPDSSGDFVSYTTFLDLDIADPTKIIYLHDKPVINLGDVGSFDQFGVMPCTTIWRGQELWLYYVGWARTRGAPWQASIGLAISRDNGVSFERYGKGPVITRTPNEPYVQGSPCIVQRAGEWNMWYLSGTKWVEEGSRIESVYKLMHATSKDGINWARDGLECIESLTEDECQARPALLVEGDDLHMWFSYRQGVDFRNPERGYGIGYAHSGDAKNWVRDDMSAGIFKSESGWDSEMISYPSMLSIRGKQYMFYCGNQMGSAGFGLAVRE